MLRKGFFDIEVYSPYEFPLPEMAKHPINAITVYDSYTDIYISIIVDPLRQGQTKKDDSWHIYYVKDEKMLIILASKMLRYMSFDVYGGWYSDSFDTPYWFNRCDNLEMKNALNSISPLNYVNIKRKSIPGIHLIDLINLDKKLKTRDSYTLENVAKEEKLSIQKSEKHEDIMEIYKNDKDRFIYYNKSDVGVLTELDKKNNLIDFFESIRTFAGLNDINEALQNAVLIDTVALRKAHGKFILPSKPELNEDEDDEDDEDDDLGGGLVRTPTPGIHSNIVVLDMAKFYPKIIQLLNLSPETIISSELTKKDIDITTGNIYVEYEEGKYVSISNKTKGFIPSLVEEFIIQRSIYDKELKKLTPGTSEHDEMTRKRDIRKFALNAIFGWTGYTKSRLYNSVISNSITFTGRKMISWTSDRLDQLNILTVYGDTDSVHAKLINQSEQDKIIDLGKKLSNQLSYEYIDVVNNMFNLSSKESFEIDFEKFFKSIIYIKKENGEPAKKRYAARCTWEKGKNVDYMYVRGFEIRRSDASKYCKNLQENVLKLILWEHPREDIIKYLQYTIDGFNDASFSDIAIPKGIKKRLNEYGKKKKNGKKGSIPAHIKGAIYSNDNLNTNFTIGSKIKYIYVKKMPPGYQETKIISFDDENKLPKGIIIDREKMKEKNIKKKIERILIATGISWNEIQGKKSLFVF